MTFSYAFYLWVAIGKGQVNLKEIFFYAKVKWLYSMLFSTLSLWLLTTALEDFQYRS